MPTRAIDMTGRILGQLTVIGRVFEPGGRNALWGCSCTCGSMTVASGRVLRNGHKKSCGCLRQVTAPQNQKCRVLKLVASKTDTEMAVSRMFTEYKGAARKFKRAFALSLETFTTLVHGDCYYCGAPPFSGFTPRSRKRRRVLLNGIDRVDSQRGYVGDNVVSCCKHCNKAKLNRSEAEFVAHCQRVVMHFEERMGPNAKRA